MQKSSHFVSNFKKNQLDYVLLNPPREIKLSKRQDKFYGEVKILNKCPTTNVIFKVRSTAPTEYVVNPNIGIIQPHQTRTVKFLLLSTDNMLER
mmetsp:Transcript_41268/g.36612  ORF Transcript_41268/g.36612 Transcript_41268/m.36612 type:complete len:94 (+) Transcript_41268:101-382(+)